MTLDKITRKLETYLEHLFQTRTSLVNAISDYDSISKENLHSWLQHSVIHTGDSLGLKSMPEVKLYYKTPLDPTKFGLVRRKNINFKKVDVCFYDNNKVIGFAEVMTLDEAHGGARSIDLIDPWLSPRDSLTYLAQNCDEEIEFCLILNVLPVKAKRIPWKTTKREHEELKKSKNYYSAFNGYWRNLINTLNQSFDSKMVTVKNVDDIETYP